MLDTGIQHTSLLAKRTLQREPTAPLSVSAEEKLTLNVLGSATSALKCIRSLKQTHLGMVIYPVKQEKKKKKEEKKQKEIFFFNCNF